MLTLGSLFDGIGGFPLAAVNNGIVPLWASEIEPFPIAVTSTHFPQMLHLGDITKLNGADAGRYNSRGQPVSRSFHRIRYKSRTCRCSFRTLHGANTDHEGDEKCRYITRTIRRVCSTQNLMLGERALCVEVHK